LIYLAGVAGLPEDSNSNRCDTKEGSNSPSESPADPNECRTFDLQTVPVCLRVRHALALPIYALSLILDFASAALGRLAAWVAGDDWPG
jgi:hypothetical protein